MNKILFKLLMVSPNQFKQLWNNQLMINQLERNQLRNNQLKKIQIWISQMRKISSKKIQSKMFHSWKTQLIASKRFAIQDQASQESIFAKMQVFYQNTPVKKSWNIMGAVHGVPDYRERSVADMRKKERSPRQVQSRKVQTGKKIQLRRHLMNLLVHSKK